MYIWLGFKTDVLLPAVARYGAPGFCQRNERIEQRVGRPLKTHLETDRPRKACTSLNGKFQRKGEAKALDMFYNR